MNKKAAIQLSMNFLVTIIIALVMLAAGIVLLRNFVLVTEGAQANVDERTEQRLAVLLDQGEQVAIPFSRQTLKRGDQHVFSVGVLNILAPPDELGTEFRIKISVSSARDSQDRDISIDLSDWVTYSDLPFSLQKNERQKVNVLVSVPTGAKSGTYIFNVGVYTTHNNKQYDNTRKIIIEVP